MRKRLGIFLPSQNNGQLPTHHRRNPEEMERNPAVQIEHSMPSVIAASVLVAMLVAGCGTQAPAFKEDRSLQAGELSGKEGASGADATAAAPDGSSEVAGEGGSGSQNGEEPISISPGTTPGVVIPVVIGGGNDPTPNPSTGGGSNPTDPGNENNGGFNLVPVVQNLVQPAPGKVDIVWVVDSSGSMAEEQSYLGSNFQAFIDGLNRAGTDFQTAVTTTDICQDQMPNNLEDRVCPAQYGGSPATHLRGSFVGDANHRILKKGDPDLLTRFLQYTNVGTNGSSFEHGLKAAQLAVSKSLAGTNDGLVRSDAFLAVIVVSDEEDDGIAMGMNDAYTGLNFVTNGLTTFKYTDDNFISYLKSAKGAGKFSVSTITGTRNQDGTMCDSPHSKPLEEGTQYIKAAKKTGGIVQSICDTNWDSSLARIGYDLNAQQTQVALTHTPDIATIKVSVDNVPSTAWTYNPNNNSIKFNADSVPTPGAAIKIQYFAK